MEELRREVMLSLFAPGERGADEFTVQELAELVGLDANRVEAQLRRLAQKGALTSRMVRLAGSIRERRVWRVSDELVAQLKAKRPG